MTELRAVEERRLPSGVVTFVFTDIEGSTKLFHELGDDYITLLDEHHRLMREAIAAHEGVEVKTEGDAFFVAYDDPASAILACRDVQLALASFQFSHGRPVRVRIGIHVGPVAIVDDDYVGLSVHEAARIGGAAHGGQILVSEDMATAAAEHLPPDVGFRDLGRHALKDFPEPRRLFQITAPGLDAAFPAPRTLTARSHNLPASPTKIIGRDSELHTIQELLLGDARLVTLTGGGGHGKSRLSIEAGWSMLSWFREGVWFVALATVTEDEDIVPTINRALGVTDEADREPIDILIERLSAGPTLLVLDNLEQLGDGVVVVADLLAACPELRVLATSRERLRLRGENEVALGGLHIDEAVALFVQRAEANNPCTDLGVSVELEAITEIAQYMDGVPLALELAAALVRDQAPSVLVTQLDRTLELLTEGERDLPARQRTLRSTIAWSHDLLDDNDRRVFELMAFFAGGASIHALLGIAQHLGIDAHAQELHAAATRLVEKALLRRANEVLTDEAPRWWVLEPIKQFAVERLGDRPDALETGRVGHAHWFTDWVCETTRDEAIEQGRRFDLFARDIDNLRLALHAGNGHRARLATELSPFWEVRGYWHEGARWLEEIDTEHASPRERCKLLVAKARLDGLFIRLNAAESRLREARALAAEIGDPSLASHVNTELAEAVLRLASEEGQKDELAVDQIDRPEERLAEARALLDEAADQAASVGNTKAEAHARSLLAQLLVDKGEVDEARAVGVAALDLHRRHGDRRRAATTLYTLATADLGHGDHAAAVERAAAGIEEARAVGDGSTEGGLLWIEAVAWANLGEKEAAFAAAEAGHEVFVKVGDEASAAGILFVRGQLAAMAGERQDAATWYQRSADAWRAFGDERRARWCEDAIAELDRPKSA